VELGKLPAQQRGAAARGAKNGPIAPNATAPIDRSDGAKKLSNQQLFEVPLSRLDL
jgi:hypothetical protein